MLSWTNGAQIISKTNLVCVQFDFDVVCGSVMHPMKVERTMYYIMPRLPTHFNNHSYEMFLSLSLRKITRYEIQPWFQQLSQEREKMWDFSWKHNDKSFKTGKIKLQMKKSLELFCMTFLWRNWRYMHVSSPVGIIPPQRDISSCTYTLLICQYHGTLFSKVV